MKIESTTRKPLTLCVLYMFSTLILYFISPIQRNTSKPIEMALLISAYIIAFAVGYIIARKMIPPSDFETGVEVDNKAPISTINIKILQKSIVALVCITLIFVIRNMSIIGSSNIMQGIKTALTDPNTVYLAKMDTEKNVFLNAISLICSPIFIYASFLGIMNFSKLKLSYKFLYITYIFLEIIRWIIIGTNKGLFDLVGLFVIAFLIKSWENNGIKKKPDLKKLLLIIALAYFAIYIFGLTISSRIGSNLSSLYSTGVTGINKDSLLFVVFPSSIAIIILRLIGYITQGYYGFALGLNLDWKPTFLLGSSSFVSSWAERIFGINIVENIYQTRIEEIYGWSSSAKWHTMYLWLANDFSFLGVILFMFVLGALFCRAIHAAIYLHNSNAMCVAYLIMMAILYSSSNNQIFGSGNTLIPFIVFLILWKLPAKKKQKAAISRQRAVT